MKNIKTRSRILLLVLLAALPGLLLSVHGVLERRSDAEAQARGELSRLARLAAMNQLQVIKSVEQTLQASALVVPSLRRDTRKCAEYFADLRSKNPNFYHVIGFFSADGSLVCDSMGTRTPLNARERPYFREAMRGGRFAIGGYQKGLVFGVEGIGFGYPVTDAQERVGVVFALVSLANFAPVAEATPLPPGGILNVVDRNGIILARKPASDARLGEKLRNEAAMRMLFSGRDGLFETKGIDDRVERLFAHDVVSALAADDGPLRVMVSVPLTEVFGEADRALKRDLSAIAAIALVLLLSAWLGAEYLILRKIRLLVVAAEAMRSGRLDVRTGIAYGEEEISRLARAFDEMADSIAQRERALREEAVTDTLTGLHNRRYFDAQLEREMARARRGGAPLAVILIDLDRFKDVNDEFGHAAGDRVLQAAAALLGRSVRAGDLACRYGGEEFALLLRHTDLASACRRAESLRAEFERLEVTCHDRALGGITASFGVADLAAGTADRDALVRAADEALYAAKRAGRNRVVLAGHAALATDAHVFSEFRNKKNGG
jgi:diguanylate cyclase (GGDEF)-like protein